ncbi:MAG: ATP-binding protein [Clostridia bacterium]|nr:ATP-binding protein [Clostridia bacterium]
MSKINILDESVFNKIAAGEVVERPYSVVKELLDNCIDAGATDIKVSIEDGGIKNITVEDNGCGIEPDDFDKVFVSHATSKIKTEKDLENIGTLGFRGEALASIASISKVKLTSKIASETFARTCEVIGGKQSETTEIGANNGTIISVGDIFFNVPARAKFLKKPKSEASEITNLVERYILCNPTIRFKYVVDGKEIYQSTGTNLFDAIFII